MPQAVKARIRVEESNQQTLLAFDGEKVIGGLCYHAIDWTENGDRDLYISNLFVREGAPKVVAAMLFQAVRDKARELGYKSVVCHAKPDSPMLRLLSSKRVEIDSYILRVKVNENPNE